MSRQTTLTCELNPEQEAAVVSDAQFLRVLAGAGSGKTRVLVHRAAFLIQQRNISPYGVLAVTFTNKAAAQMRHRIESLCGISTKGMWVGTFHALAHRFLRIHYKDAGLDEQFQIIDSDDQLRCVKRVIKELEIHETDFSPKQAVSYINREKDEGRYPTQATGLDRQTGLLQSVYARYQLICQQSNVVDFAELLLRSLTLFETHPAIAQYYKAKFQSILVDEFQDTNAIQFRWLQAMLGPDNALTIVGDDDQSIYGWRGAQIENILRFTDLYPQTQTVRLEQNYRSTKAILAAANGVIACNRERLGKALWTEGDAGERVQLYAAYNEIDEARFIVERIADCKAKGFEYKQQAILYRSNAQSRVLEEAFLHAKMPYRIYGGQRFFDRAEIKSALAYLRLVSLADDDAAFERVINFPTRGLGDRSVQQIRDLARAHNISLWQASLSLVQHQGLTARALKALTGFIALIDALKADATRLVLSEFVSLLLQKTQLINAYSKESIEQRQTREENLKELISATVAFNQIAEVEHVDLLDPHMRAKVHDDGFLPPRRLDASNDFKRSKDQQAQFHPPLGLITFLDHVSLESGEMQASAQADAVQMMTIHASKGLEFPVVFLSGLEEGLFPSQMSMNEPGRIEEERRLCYVGMTRAEQLLTISYAESRRIYGEERSARVSRFVREIPNDVLHEIRMGNVLRTAFQPRPVVHFGAAQADQADALAVQAGERVMHQVFGEGVVLATEGRGVRLRVQVNFAKAGSKWLMANVAKLSLVE